MHVSDEHITYYAKIGYQGRVTWHYDKKAIPDDYESHYNWQYCCEAQALRKRIMTGELKISACFSASGEASLFGSEAGKHVG